MDRRRQFLQIAGLMPEATLLLDEAGRILEANPAAATELGIPRSALKERSLAQLALSPEPRALADHLKRCARTRELLPGAITLSHGSDEAISYRSDCGLAFPRGDTDGASLLMRLIRRNTSATQFTELNRKIEELQASRRALQEQVRAQRERIQEMSAPVIGVKDGVLMLPLVGPIDADGAPAMIEKVASRVVATRARWIIVDLTGASVVDPCAMEQLVMLARTVRLLGAQCVLTGLGPELARTMLASGGRLDGLCFMRSVKEGLDRCLDPRSN